VNGIAFYSCYLPASLSLRQAMSALEEIAQDARENRFPPTYARGKALLESFAALDLVLLNFGTKPTFSRAGTSSIIDLTFVNAGLASA